MWQFWVDRGGTFTDIVAKSPEGAVQTHKLLSENPERYQDAAVEGIRNILGLAQDASIPDGMIHSVKMGTTVATNALLERKGDRTVLMITRGFRDLLRIGYQNRPRLFDLEIKLPELLYESAVEAHERLAADGTVLTPLDEEAARADLASAFDNGIRSVAIALLHGYRYPAHEIRLGEIAAEIGFEQISLSHQVSPLIKLVSRGDTTVVDAYLSPILRRYVRQVSNAIKSTPTSQTRLMFMQSNGGLTDANLFEGKDAILSGPAGGVVGMVESAKVAGFDKIIGFDMGGTSTDVAHFAGEYERSFETEVAGVRMRAPMMAIHTVAAGGGSILSFRQGRLQVGPESAGANPGPASYRRGGPLTMTDCNVLLGKIQADEFPAVFGPNGDERLDVDVVRTKFEEMSARIAEETGDAPRTPEELAEGFLRIGVENMANAVKKISVERGYDVTEYVLNSFGGAGGQHACLVADVLGMKQVYIHPFAGVLSAFGMGLADIRAIRERQFGGAIDDLTSAQLILDELTQSARNEVANQGIADHQITINQVAHIRTRGAQQSLEVAFTDANTMRTAFVAAHEARFGFTPRSDDLIIEILVAEAIGNTGEVVTLEQATPSDVAQSKAVRTFTKGQWQEIPFVDRSTMIAGTTVNGPAIIGESTGTNMIEPGWAAEMTAAGDLIVKRISAIARENAAGTTVDPILLEVFNNLFMSVAEQMGATLANTANSVNIKERYDFSCAIFDANGDLVANAPHVPVHLGSMSESVRVILRENAATMKPGDVFMMNNPFNGGTHLPDVTVITPVFDAAGKDVIFTVASRGHHADIGGKTPGSAPPDSRHIEEEGVVIDNFLLVAAGELREMETRELLASGRYPARNIDQNMADLSAQIAANATGVAELQKAVHQFGLEIVQSYMRHVQDNAEESVRQVLDVLSDSRFIYPLDSGARIQVAITVDKENRGAVIDFNGTSPQDELNYNAPLSICRAVVLYVFRCLVGTDIPMNEGCLRPLDIRVPQGSMINPNYPAAVISGNTEVSQAIADTLFGALGVIAGSQGTMNNFVYGNTDYQNYETICGGTGAGDGFNGTDAVHSHMTNTRMTDPEVLEGRFPVRLEEFSIRRGSGGDGQWRGGDGIIRHLRFLEPTTVTVLSSHRSVPPHGANGGKHGKTGENWVERANGDIEQLKGNDQRELSAGDAFIMHTPGGGGYR